MPAVPNSKPDPAAALGRASVVDRPAARAAALAVVLLVLAAVVWIHRDSLFPPEAAATPADDAAARCLAKRAAEVDKMVAEGVIGEDQAALFKSRAEAFCTAQFGAGRPSSQ
jgi:hypothetical protein